MKSITLKITKETLANGKETFFTSYDLLKIAINNTPQGGFDVDEMMKRLRLLELVEKHKDQFSVGEEEFTDEMLSRTAILELEDADFNKLKELFRQSKWGVISKSILELSSEFDKN